MRNGMVPLKMTISLDEENMYREKKMMKKKETMLKEKMKK